MGKSSSPPAPDYKGAAQQTAEGNLENLKYQTVSNSPTEVTPWGTSSWVVDPNSGQRTNTVTLSGQQQDALNGQMKIQANQSALAQSLQSRVSDAMAMPDSTPSMSSYMAGVHSVDQSAPQFSTADRHAGIDAAYKASTSLLQPQFDIDNKNLDEKLRLQGLQPGTEAYQNAMLSQHMTQEQQLNNAAANAVDVGSKQANNDYASALAGYGAGNQAQAQANDQALQNWQAAYTANQQQREQPLNEMNAVLSGNQVAMPNFPTFAQTGYTPGADMLGAAQATGQYNSAATAAKNAQQSSTMGTVASLAMAAAMAF